MKGVLTRIFQGVGVVFIVASLVASLVALAPSPSHIHSQAPPNLWLLAQYEHFVERVTTIARATMAALQ